MTKNDKNTLESLVVAYSLKDIVDVLAKLAANRADEMSDMGLKERAISWSDAASILNEAAVTIDE